MLKCGDCWLAERRLAPGCSLATVVQKESRSWVQESKGCHLGISNTSQPGDSHPNPDALGGFATQPQFELCHVAVTLEAVEWNQRALASLKSSLLLAFT